MSHRQLLYEDAAPARVLRGASALADAVRLALGPKSRSVLADATLTEIPEPADRSARAMEPELA